MAKTEYKVGETFQFGLKTLKCVEAEKNCEGCILTDIENCNEFVGSCYPNTREDHKDVIFIEVEETNKQEGDEIKQTVEEAAHLFAESRSSGSMFPAYYDGFIAGTEWKSNQSE